MDMNMDMDMDICDYLILNILIYMMRIKGWHIVNKGYDLR